MEKRRKLFRYGMRLRGFAPGCQPKNDLIEAREDPAGKYYHILIYGRRLTDKEVSDYELDDLNRSVKNIAKHREIKGLKQQDLADMLNVSVRKVEAWEAKGMNTVKLSLCVEVADILGCNVRDLYDEN